ncbi:helix-turn-helix domain-containing protein [Shewanella sp. A25]|nr:helix-turn-helix domain-containing protein [Shewanella shenzhenensis]
MGKASVSLLTQTTPGSVVQAVAQDRSDDCQLSPTICREARLSKDPRFDGKFFVGVFSTGIYCRPVCPAVAPKEENVRYFDSAIKAAQAGLRPCLRCRPDSAPGSNPWKGTGTTLDRAIQLIDMGALAGEQGLSVTELAEKLGISSRYLNKLFTDGFGTSPKQYALYRQLLFAKQLLHQTQLPITQIALAAGFNSIRRFNEAFQQTLQLTPTQLRRASMNKLQDELKNKVSTELTTEQSEDVVQQQSLSLSLYQYYRPPLDWASQIAFYQLRSVTGMEWFKDDDQYGRTLAIGDLRAVIDIRHEPDFHRFNINIRLKNAAELDKLQPLLAEVRRILDLDADLSQIEESIQSLSQIRLSPKSGLRIPGAGSLFEAACRAVLGQQVSVVQATKLLNVLVDAYGEHFELDGNEYRLFPTPDAIRRASLVELKMPGSRKLALNALAAFICDNPNASVDDWIGVKGIGPWTIAYAKLRGQGEPNIFLHTDLIVKKQLLAIFGALNQLDKESLKEVNYPELCHSIANAIAPWGSYLTFQLWAQA